MLLSEEVDTTRGRGHREAVHGRLMFSAHVARSCQKLISIKIWLPTSWFMRGPGKTSNRRAQWMCMVRHCQQVSHSLQIESLEVENRSRWSCQGEDRERAKQFQARISISKSATTPLISQNPKSKPHSSKENLKIRPQRCQTMIQA